MGQGPMVNAKLGNRGGKRGALVALMDQMFQCVMGRCFSMMKYFIKFFRINVIKVVTRAKELCYTSFHLHKVKGQAVGDRLALPCTGHP